MSERTGPSNMEFWAGDDDRTALHCCQALVETIEGGVFQLDADGQFVAADETFLEMTGYGRIDLFGQHVSTLLSFRGVAQFERDVRAQWPSGGDGVTALTGMIETVDGTTVHCDIRLNQLQTDGCPQGSVGVVQKVDRADAGSEHHSTAEAVFGPTAAALEEADIGVFVLDEEFNVAWINETAEQYFGIDRTAVLGQQKRQLIEERIQDRLADPEAFADTVIATYDDNSYVEHFECHITPGDDREERWLEHRSRPIEAGPYAGGRIELYYDVTDRHRRAYQLRRLNKAVREWIDGDSREDVAKRACQDLLDILNFELNGIHLYEPETQTLEPVARSEPAGALFDELPTFGEGEGVAWHVFESGEPAIYSDVTDDPRVYNPATPIRSELCLPIGDHGVMLIGSESRDAFDDSDLSFAKIIASSLEATFDRLRHEHHLERERAQTEELLRTAPVAISVTDATGDPLLLNRRARERYGAVDDATIATIAAADEWTVADAAGRSLTTDETPAARVRATGEPVTDEELVIDSPSGERTWLSVNAAPVFDPNGSLARVITIGEDITVRKSHEHSLERRKSELETELSEILGRVSDAFYALDESWRFTHVNERAEELLGYSSDELLGEVIWDVFPGGTRSELVDRYQEAMNTQESITWERYSRSLELWMEIQVYPSETGLSVYFRDITARKRREQQLGRYERIIETIDDGIYVLDGDERFTAVNDAYTELTGYDRDELLGAHASLVTSETVIGHTKQVATDDSEPSTIETTLKTKSGTQVPIEATVTAISTAEQTATDAAADSPSDAERAAVETTGHERAGIVRDITERKEYQRKLEASNERLEQFAYAASHDLQEPLRMVSSYLQLIERRYADVLDDDGLEFLGYAVDGAERMSAMIDALLEYSRVETQGNELEPVALDAVFDDAREDLTLRIEEQDADVTTASLPAVCGDANQLRQVFQNLLSNALEYSGDGPPQVHVSADRDGDEWTVSVHDEGIGMDPDETDRIFEVFQRLHSHDEHPGTGIGLALCRRIIERHGGDIWVETEPGEGATFSMTLPALERCE
ncbi:PAS domain S-box protein [Natronorubrum bangense]|nr:PAS domain S-box protein [Natronorubrum bangense]